MESFRHGRNNGSQLVGVGSLCATMNLHVAPLMCNNEFARRPRENLDVALEMVLTKLAGGTLPKGKFGRGPSTGSGKHGVGFESKGISRKTFDNLIPLVRSRSRFHKWLRRDNRAHTRAASALAPLGTRARAGGRSTTPSSRRQPPSPNMVTFTPPLFPPRLSSRHAVELGGFGG